MLIIDNSKRPIDGIVQCIRTFADGSTKIEFEEKNLVLNGGSTLLRDMLFGDAGLTLTKMIFGDQNLDPDVDDIVNVDPPLLTDTTLTNNLFTKATSSTKVTYGGHPAIKYEAIIAAIEFNGAGQQLITEFALSTASDILFSKKTKSAIFKDAESSLTFIWYLVFN